MDFYVGLPMRWGQKPLPKKVTDPNLKYARVVKEHQSKTISTSFIETRPCGRNGTFRKDNKRQTRRTKRFAAAMSFKKNRTSRCLCNISKKHI